MERILTLLHSIAQDMRAANLADTAGCAAACRAVAAFLGQFFGQGPAAAHSAPPSGAENDRPGAATAEGVEEADEDEEVCFPYSRLP